MRRKHSPPLHPARTPSRLHAKGVNVNSRGVEEALRRHPRKTSHRTPQSERLLVLPIPKPLANDEPISLRTPRMLREVSLKLQRVEALSQRIGTRKLNRSATILPPNPAAWLQGRRNQTCASILGCVRWGCASTSCIARVGALLATVVLCTCIAAGCEKRCDGTDSLARYGCEIKYVNNDPYVYDKSFGVVVPSSDGALWANGDAINRVYVTKNGLCVASVFLAKNRSPTGFCLYDMRTKKYHLTRGTKAEAAKILDDLSSNDMEVPNARMFVAIDSE